MKLNNNPVTVDQSGRFSIQPSLLQTGIQTITISFVSNTATTTLSTQFNITPAAKPEVKLASNLNSVDNGSTTIILAATQMGGGGSTPLYTFATNRNFTNLIQGESLINTITFNSQILNNGDNWLYVRMKTSESCYTSLTTVDSIKIIRLSVTSIVDINFPGATIIAYPNPFKSDLTIKGLQPVVSYTIQLIDATGRIIVAKDVENKSSIAFNNISLKNGKYFIRLYDKKTSRLIGSISVLKI